MIARAAERRYRTGEKPYAIRLYPQHGRETREACVLMRDPDVTDVPGPCPVARGRSRDSGGHRPGHGQGRRLRSGQGLWLRLWPSRPGPNLNPSAPPCSIVRARCFAGFLPARRPELHPDRGGRVLQEQVVRAAQDDGQTRRPSLALGAKIGIRAPTAQHSYAGLVPEALNEIDGEQTIDSIETRQTIVKP